MKSQKSTLPSEIFQKCTVAAVLILILLLFSCQENSKITRSYDDGVEIIQYHDIEDWLPRYQMELKEITAISGYYRDSLFFPFAELWDFLIDRESNFFILERNTCRVYKFSRAGKLLKTFGHRGLGPGETTSPGPLFFSEGSFYLLSQAPQKLIRFDPDLNYLADISLEPHTVFWVFRDQNNEANFFLTLDLLKTPAKRNSKSHWLRAYHTFNSPEFRRDTLATNRYHVGGEKQGNTIILDYTVPARFLMAADSTFWINQTVAYRIHLKNKHKPDKIIVIEYPLSELSEREKKELKEKALSRNFGSILAQAGLKKKVRNFPEYQQQITAIDQLNEEIWVTVFSPADKENQEIHVYDLQGTLKKLISTEDARFSTGRKKYARGDTLYMIETGENGDTAVKCYTMNFANL